MKVRLFSNTFEKLAFLKCTFMEKKQALVLWQWSYLNNQSINYLFKQEKDFLR